MSSTSSTARPSRRVPPRPRQRAGEVGGEHEGAVEDHDHHEVLGHGRGDARGQRVDARGDGAGVDQGAGRIHGAVI
jgi:hypothetical protein